MIIIYSGLQEETILNLKTHHLLNEAEFQNFDEAEITTSIEKLKNADVLIIGEQISNPIKLSQQVYQLEPHLSIVIINNQQNYQKIRQSLLFTPFVGPTIHNVSNSAGKGLGAVIFDHQQRSKQRRSYHKIKSSAFSSPVNSVHKFENLKNEYLHKVMEEAPIGVSLINSNGTILTLNNYTASIFNKTESEVLGTSIATLFPEIYKDDFFSLSGSNGMYHEKTFKISLNNKVKYLNVALASLKGNPTYKIALIDDVTKQRLAQQEIEDSARRINLILDSMPELAWTALPNGKINYFNRSWYNFTGQRFDKPEEASWEAAIHPDDAKRVRKKWTRSLNTGEDLEVECRYKSINDHQYRWHIKRAVPVKDDKGNISLWIGTCTDIQEIHSVQQELQATAEELAASNEELQAANEEISSNNEELQRSNDTLVKLNADLDNFIYTASHDLKAPITNIEGLVSYLKNIMAEKGWGDQTSDGIIEMINTSISRFRKTITDLTEISKIQRVLDLNSAEVNLKDVVNEVILDLHHQIKEAEADIHVELSEDLMIQFSIKNLKSIVYNLLSNAIKYRSGEKKLHISVTATENGQHFILNVKDNGLGFDLKDKPKIFSMFKRLHSHVEGTGIGLYMVKKIMDNAGGDVDVDSNLGEGSTFKVFFPKK